MNGTPRTPHPHKSTSARLLAVVTLLLITTKSLNSLVINPSHSTIRNLSMRDKIVVDLRMKPSPSSSTLLSFHKSNIQMYRDAASTMIAPPPVLKDTSIAKRIPVNEKLGNPKLTRMQKDDVTKIGTLKVSSVGVGTISWSSDSWTSIENDKLQSVVSAACETRNAFFDTAERYGSHLKTAIGLGWGETETLMNKLLKERSSSLHMENSAKVISSPVVATKFTPSPWRTNAKSVVDACKQSCSRLGVDQIDLYQLHMPDIVQPLRFMGKDVPKDEAYWDGLAECYNRGLVKNVGVSNYGPTLLYQCKEALAKRGVPLASNQIAYSLLGRQNGAQETLDLCNDIGVTVLACYPFAMGLLTGKYSTKSFNNAVLSGDLSKSLMKNQKTALEVNDLEKYAFGDGDKIPLGGITPLLCVLEDIAQKRSKTVAQVALNYIICKGAVPIPGANTQAQVVDNMGATGWRLNAAEILSLERASDGLGFGFEGAGFKRTNEKFVGYGVETWRLD